jgi:hypothetical protein
LSQMTRGWQPHLRLQQMGLQEPQPLNMARTFGGDLLNERLLLPIIRIPQFFLGAIIQRKSFFLRNRGQRLHHPLRSHAPKDDMVQLFHPPGRATMDRLLEKRGEDPRDEGQPLVPFPLFP